MFPRAELRDLRGTFDLEPDELSVANGSARVGDSSASHLDGRLSFSKDAERPYSLKATLSFDNVDSAPIFRAINPDRSPEVEGRFDVVSHLTGSGTGLGEILEGAQGDLRLSSKDGRFRALRTDIVDSIKQAPLQSSWMPWTRCNVTPWR